MSLLIRASQITPLATKIAASSYRLPVAWTQRANSAATFATTVQKRGVPLLFTPGPLTTTARVKEAMLVDLGSRDTRFMNVLANIRSGLLALGGVSQEEGYECVIVQGAGSHGIEAVLGTSVPRKGGKLLILSNGAYGMRQAQICEYLGIEYNLIDFTDRKPVDVTALEQALAEDSSFTHVGMVHHETTAGVINDVKSVGQFLASEYPKVELVVDAMSSMGAYELPLKDWNVSYAVSSANKCIEGVPGFCFALCKRSSLLAAEGNARSFCMDLYAQWKGLETTGQFRFTPPTHVILAFNEALKEWEEEGGVEGRFGRYKQNYDIICAGMEEMGFQYYVESQWRGVIITTFMQPAHVPGWDFDRFYRFLGDRGLVIYPGKLASGLSFRLGTIGRISPDDCRDLIDAIRDALRDMDISTPIPPPLTSSS
ncbi:2-aminoethylphosphonate--pyruvate aminotransferase, putative [Perkinsus marinus ATCC 50983]|uniref:2-aminoethylphosphonate--pyruvate aminotransferase, putative n=1 Tax=Perkinsus marinus (strain ATCC 50983 / TXsc) TaxID=423536 RepID=C5LLR3_PERM5|nr:2-aminoethylphosphonate--pyruvate aminotransferase, putative [Perkinsus marinus ATCC 50983]EER02285.1 2-aminoethylphosphonate--pyruvate aminotransferase, putative [Perkinsus marinus ATCC 50983]|eukprot:XP_002769567.1 2-aminoethylphosphonate--pyruvate aminotransferase, putative [Perkinsus marinus ATCC 50983]